MVYTCVLHVLHVSSLAKNYTRFHTVCVRTTSLAAMSHCGVQPLRNSIFSLRKRHSSSLLKIMYSNGTQPTIVDPSHVLLYLSGLAGALWVEIPYQCTYEHLCRQIIPAKLRKLGVHPYNIYGSMAYSHGAPVLAHDLWSGAAQHKKIWWTKLGCRVQHTWPCRIVQAVRALQRRWRQKER